MNKTNFPKLFIILSAMMFAGILSAQVTIGSSGAPQVFSILELVSNNTRGLRLPQLSADQREALNLGSLTGDQAVKAQGLQIFNTTTHCVETWNGVKWISQCSSGLFVNYVLNGGTNNAGNPAFFEDSDDNLPFTLYEPTKSLSEFKGWYTEPIFTNPMTTILSGTTGSITLYAKWEELIATVPPEQGGGTATAWVSDKYRGAFWRDNQTGERVIAGIGIEGQPWTAVVYDATGSGIWLTLAPGRKDNPTLYTDAPDDAELYQLAAGVTSLSGTGDIVFRIGATGTNPNPESSDYKYPDNSNGKAPRYAKVVVHVNNSYYRDTIFCRQGEAADYVFRPTDAMNGGTHTVSNKRDLAVKFSPYNLTDSLLPYAPVTPVDVNYAVISHKTAINGGVFVDYPTKPGAFWQWGTDLTRVNYADYIRRAYHPSLPAGSVTEWNNDDNYDIANQTWDEFTGDYRLETCPSGWRRPTVGDTTTIHDTQFASESELMQSLFYRTFDGSYQNGNLENNRYTGYYADGYFDRRPMDSRARVSGANKDVAYCGLVCTNPWSGASLFLPYGGNRYLGTGMHENSLSNSSGSYWTRSAYNNQNAWSLKIDRDGRGMHVHYYRSTGMNVRCVRE